jgi:PAS domain S-box-containing protein
MDTGVGWREAEEELRKSEARFRALVATSLDCIVMMDHLGMVVEFNPAAEQTFGYLREEAVGQPLAELIIPASLREAHHRGLARFLATGAAKAMNRRLELTAMHRNGREFPVELTITVMYQFAGTPLFAGYLRDLTERRRAEETIHRLAHRNELLLRSVGDGIYGLDDHGLTSFVNPAALRMLGLREDEVLGRPIHPLIHHTHADGRPYPACDCPNHDSFHNGVSHQVQGEVFWRGDGTSFPVEYTSTPVREADGRLVGAVVVFRDISDRIEAEAALTRERDFIRAAIDSLPGVFYLISRDGRFLLWNQNVERVTGYTAEEVAALSPLDLFNSKEKPRIAAAIREVYDHGSAEVEALLLGRDGHLTPYYFTGSLCRERDCLIGMGLDISARKAVEEALVNSNRSLEEFAYVASHDLREPLRMVSNFLSLVERRLADRLDDETREFIGFATNGARRMDRLVLDLLDYSRVGRLGAEKVPIPLAQALEVAMDNLRFAIEDSGAEITLPANPPTILATMDDMVRLFQNLFGNAIKYRAATGPLRIVLEARPKDGGWLFSVSDNGIGFAPEMGERIFGIFKRLHGQQSYEGTGIGLAVCRKIVEAHGGTIWAASPGPDNGATFFLTLPAG